LKIGNPSTQLGTQLENEIDGTRGLSSRAGYARTNLVAQMKALNALGPPTQDPH